MQNALQAVEELSQPLFGDRCVDVSGSFAGSTRGDVLPGRIDADGNRLLLSEREVRPLYRVTSVVSASEREAVSPIFLTTVSAI